MKRRGRTLFPKPNLELERRAITVLGKVRFRSVLSGGLCYRVSRLNESLAEARGISGIDSGGWVGSTVGTGVKPYRLNRQNGQIDLAY